MKPIEQILNENNMSIQDFANATGLSYNTVWKIVRRNCFEPSVRVSTLAEVGGVLDLTLEQMLKYVKLN